MRSDCTNARFADIHYYFAAPTPKPLHHRFDKGSYLYIYHDASQNKARIEVANNPGTPEQNAFHGSLDNVHIRHSTQFPTRCTLTVDGSNNVNSQQGSQYEWRLPDADPRNERHSLFRLHTLDIYFWTLDDADQFLDTISLLLSVSQLDTDREDAAAQSEQQMSSVVQQLENVVVSDPAYQKAQVPNSYSEPGAVPGSVSQDTPPTMSFPPPPPSGPSVDQQQVNFIPNLQSPAEEEKETEKVAPLPYNPAAPAAPEPIKHREKTPPPEDGTEGTGLLAAAAAADRSQPYTPPHQVNNGPGMSFAPPPTSPPVNSYTSPPPVAPTGYASPPPSAGLPRSPSFPPHHQQQPMPSPGFPPYAQHHPTPQAWPGSPGTMTFSPPPQDLNAHFYAQQTYGAYGMPQSPPHQMGHAAPPIGGYSNYSYEQPATPRQPGSEYDVHSQLYRPTEAEANSHAQKYAQRAMKAPGQRPRKLEDNAAKLESGVNRLLKKLEKKL